MNVLLLSQFYSTTKGGGEYVFKTIAESLAKNNHKVWVITSKIKDETYQESENVKIITIQPELAYKGGLPPSFTDNIKYVLNSYKQGRKIIKNHNIDIIHSNNFSPALAGSILSYFTKVPHITTIHDIFSIYDKEFWKKWASQSNVSYTNARLIPFFEKLMMGFKIRLIHTVSDATKTDIEKLGTRKPIHVIPNCIRDEEVIIAKPKNNQLAYLGRLVFYKNIEVIIKAFKIVSKEFPDVILIIAGDGPHRSSLQNLVAKLDLQNNIKFTGYVTADEKKILLAESNALLFPSTIEGFGLVILEAWQQKRPVIASDMPPMSDIIQDSKTGFLIDPNNEKQWAEKIIELIKNQNISDEMGNAGYQVLKSKYNEALFYQNLIKMYDNVLKTTDQKTS
ncbi:MAG: glycosyltransferase family 4 protein [Nitrosopumilus sp.]|uniref:glycosyltransferase family 4 protein n=1 Tax=Nitrosopumilus sp. TaxID=2024843 RepID=UPI00247C3E4F|nr:glycosyltransferase family 4 protein [Nitrosopumilus sp.]MCV0393516.1 glycosyltransferase family 4 protein [Nitrosopumilus sp.]